MIELKDKEDLDVAHAITGLGEDCARSVTDNWRENSEHLLDDSMLSQTVRLLFGEQISQFMEYYQYARDLCDSPIEQRFLEALFFAASAHGAPIESSWMRAKDGRDPKAFANYHLHVYPQWEFDLKRKYRVDFYLVHKTHPVYGESVVRTAIIECDGHDFHERTKEQAAKDKSRDRDLVAAGHAVFRFTGSEVHKRAYECADEVMSFITRTLP